MYSEQSKREKIPCIILGFNPCNFSRESKYCRLQIIKNIKPNAWAEIG